MKFSITIGNTGESYACAADRNLLAAMEQLGRRGIPVGCRNGGCGVCKIKITSGEYTTRVMSRAHISEEDEANGIVLACRAFPRSDLHLQAIDKMAVCIEKSFERSRPEPFAAIPQPARNESAQAIAVTPQHD